jgi:Bacterial protein of unknown function (DUF882)
VADTAFRVIGARDNAVGGKRVGTALVFAFVASTCSLASGCGKDANAGAISDQALSARTKQSSTANYSGTDFRGIPRYVNRTFTSEERAILRQAFGVVSPSHIYLSDSTNDGALKYDPEVKTCSWCYVDSFRLGYISVRSPGESWDDLERRVHRMRRSSSLSSLDPDIQDEVREMLDAARRSGFDLHVVTTYRSPQFEALLMAEGHGRTFTLTSLHSYGRAIDITVVGDGNLHHRPTRIEWIAFRRWVTHYRGTDFRVLGTPDHTWDWTHVEVPSDKIGFRSIEQALAAGKACLSGGARGLCLFAPHLPPAN